MSTLGKVFTVAVLVLSLVFSVFSMALFAKRHRWQADALCSHRNRHFPPRIRLFPSAGIMPVSGGLLNTSQLRSPPVDRRQRPPGWYSRRKNGGYPAAHRPLAAGRENLPSASGQADECDAPPPGLSVKTAG